MSSTRQCEPTFPVSFLNVPDHEYRRRVFASCPTFARFESEQDRKTPNVWRSKGPFTQRQGPDKVLIASADRAGACHPRNEAVRHAYKLANDGYGKSDERTLAYAKKIPRLRSGKRVAHLKIPVFLELFKKTPSIADSNIFICSPFAPANK
ncbi:hypothetical protein KM043_007056 [Ampulex compressa]|nr:hypothetical protein KM043_007056 [Ampulex compressa]